MLEVLFADKTPKSAIVKVIPMFENTEVKGNFLNNDEALLVQKAIKQADFKAAYLDYTPVFGGREKIILFGLGKKNTLDIQKAGETLFKILYKDEKAYIATFDDETALNLAYGILLGSYNFDKYKTEKTAEDYPKLEQIILSVSDEDTVKEAFKPYMALATGIRYCKDLCNEPASYLTPKVFADDIKRLEYLGLDVKILDGEQIALQGLGLVQAVAKGSAEESRVVIMSWRGNHNQESYDLALVGKGVCFDAGGLSLKTTPGMLEMKMDMSGAAAVVSTLKAAALQRTRKNLLAIVGLVENMPGCKAMKIGDVYSAYNGKTVEIINTDAEGRLVVADCLAYLQKNYAVKKIIDMATIGSLRTILGDVYSGMFSNDDKLADMLLKAGEISGENLWKMPLDKEYKKMLSSPIADIRNVALDNKASIVSASFLNEFIEKGTKWAHIDISGCRLNHQKTASGFGVKLLDELIKGL
ncbi:MAG: leucyl aminopeptidase family protein [Alphaproteobacteria bacterium]|nr:leucyl aminopeptidase family protein [Alphaproteobacteria bacterium]